MREEIKRLSEKKPYLFWDIATPEALSEEALLEIVLSRGDFDDFIWLLRLFGLKRLADIFYKQVTAGRSNYKKRTINYFKHFFERNSRDV